MNFKSLYMKDELQSIGDELKNERTNIISCE
jgi:hypothetical protein